MLVEGVKEDADFIKLHLPLKEGFSIECVNTLEEAINKISDNSYDCILIDTVLDDQYIISTVERIRAKTSRIPIIVISNSDDEEMAVNAIRKGAHDYFIKNCINGRNLSRCVIHSIERHKVRIGFHDLALIDELTGLYNRRGFLFLANQQMAMAKRDNKEFLIIYADLDGLKKINDIYGHDAGDKALVSLSEVLFSSFRRTDIIARLGGDEFAVVVLNIGGGYEDKISKLLNERISEANKRSKESYKLELSFGVVKVTCGNTLSLDELLSEADNLMYYQKNRKKQLG